MKKSFETSKRRKVSHEKRAHKYQQYEKQTCSKYKSECNYDSDFKSDSKNQEASFQFLEDSFIYNIHDDIEKIENQYFENSQSSGQSVNSTNKVVESETSSLTSNSKLVENSEKEDSVFVSKQSTKATSISKVSFHEKGQIENNTSHCEKHNDKYKDDHTELHYEGHSQLSSEEIKCSLLLNSNVNSKSGVVSCGLASQIKCKLKHNAQCTEDTNYSILAAKESIKANAVEDAKKIHLKFGDTDVGSFFGLPAIIPSLLKQHRGIEELYPWQIECLTLKSIKERKNLIYSLPTSGGKTLVAEILILKEILCNKKNAIFVLPYIAIVQEKVRSLSTFAIVLNFSIEEYAGSKGVFPPSKRQKSNSLYVCTIEKAHSLLNSLIETNRLEEIGIVVIDELHMIGSGGSRGAILESMITKIRYITQDIQIIGMSATLGNIDDLATFLKAEVYNGDFRPIPLTEYIKVDNQLIEFNIKNFNTSENFHVVRNLNYDYSSEMLKLDPDFLLGLVLEVVPQNSCLIFCPTKRHCENIASLFSQLMPKNIKKHKWEEKKGLYEALKLETNGPVCPVLKRSLQYGVAYHHSGLTSDERKLIEEAYINGILCCLTCTSTLAAGVNLPAKRVILRAPYIGREFISYGMYKQMVGRAGRAGLDVSGESILIIKPCDVEKVKEMFLSGLEVCTSSLLHDDGQSFYSLLLSIVGLEIATTKFQMEQFIDSTLYAIQFTTDINQPKLKLREALEYLIDHNLLIYELNSDTLKVTKNGTAIFKSGIETGISEILYKNLERGLNGLMLNSYLHLLYLVTPLESVSGIPISPNVYFEAFMSLDSTDICVAEKIGIRESSIVQLASGRAVKSTDMEMLHFFYITLILYDLWKQKSVWEVAHKFQLHRGVVQSVLSSAACFASSVTHFCQEFEEFWAYQNLLPDFSKQLSYCTTMELVPLMELPAVKRGRARQLYNAGYKTLTDIAQATSKDLVKKVEFMPHRVANEIISVAKLLLIQKAEILREEAEDLMAACHSLDDSKTTEIRS